VLLIVRLCILNEIVYFNFSYFVIVLRSFFIVIFLLLGERLTMPYL
jgi:hypothetical protein